MSYCRVNGIDSDVYVIKTRHDDIDGYECVGCPLRDGEGNLVYFTPAPASMAEHLYEHCEAGHMVPQRAIDRLIEEDLDLDGK